MLLSELRMPGANLSYNVWQTAGQLFKKTATCQIDAPLFSGSPLQKGHGQDREGAGLHSLGRVSSPGGICVLTLEISTPLAQEEARECRPTFTKSSISGSLSSPLAVAESVIPSAPRTTVPGRRGATSAALQAPAHSGGPLFCTVFNFVF